MFIIDLLEMQLTPKLKGTSHFMFNNQSDYEALYKWVNSNCKQYAPNEWAYEDSWENWFIVTLNKDEVFISKSCKGLCEMCIEHWERANGCE